MDSEGVRVFNDPGPAVTLIRLRSSARTMQSHAVRAVHRPCGQANEIENNHRYPGVVFAALDFRLARGVLRGQPHAYA